MKYIYITSLSDTINGVDMVVSRIKDYIDKFYKELSSNEMLTRQVIINRVLELIGYDPRDPSKVICEYSTLTGKTDYAIFDDGKPIAIIEAKKLDEEIKFPVMQQASNYALSIGAKYFIITNGRE